MTLSERQDKERKALIEEIIDLVDEQNEGRIYDLAYALKWVTTDPKTYFDNLDKEE